MRIANLLPADLRHVSFVVAPMNFKTKPKARENVAILASVANQVVYQ